MTQTFKKVYNGEELDATAVKKEFGLSDDKLIKNSVEYYSKIATIEDLQKQVDAAAPSSVDNKQKECKSNTQETYREYLSTGETLTHKQIPVKSFGVVVEAVSDEYEGALSVGNPQENRVQLNPINYIDLKAVENEELKAELAALEERHVKDGAELDAMRGKYHAEKTHNARHCDELVMERRKNKELDAQNRNLLAQLKRQDELLIAADRDRKLLFMTMEKAVEQNKQMQVAVEGGEY